MGYESQTSTRNLTIEACEQLKCGRSTCADRSADAASAPASAVGEGCSSAASLPATSSAQQASPSASARALPSATASPPCLGTEDPPVTSITIIVLFGGTIKDC